MDSKPIEDSSVQSPTKDVDIQTSSDPVVGSDKSPVDASTKLPTSGISTWAKNLRIPQSLATQEGAINSGKLNFTRFTSGFSLRLSPKSHNPDDNIEHASTSQTGLIGTLTRGLVDSSKNAVKAMQVRARHAVSQNKRRYQEGGFDLDMTYITENIIAMGFPAGDMSSGFFGYVEGFYRNHMEEVIKFFETHHQSKYKVYNLCSERLYDASLFEGKVASFPFDDHNCPPVRLIILFCQSAYSWLKEDIENVVVVHCKAGMARTGLMISSLLLFLKFFPTAEESIDYYNQKRCFDGKGLVLPSQIRYVKYFERILTYFNGENLPGRRCMLRGIRLHRCPYWIRPSITVSNHNDLLFSTKKHPRTKDIATEDFWFNAPKKGLVVFALPGEPGLTELTGDFKIHFHDKHGDFYFWLNTTMLENRKFLGTDDLDGFDKRKLPSPGFQVEIVLADCDRSIQTSKETTISSTSDSGGGGGTAPLPSAAPLSVVVTEAADGEGGTEKDMFSDNEVEETWQHRGRDDLTAKVESLSLQNKSLPTSDEGGDTSSTLDLPNPTAVSEFKAMAADASVFTFGDEDDDDYESD